jgi:hypothetical protein
MEPTQPPIINDYGSIYSEVKQLGREGDHSPPYSAEIKNGGGIPQFPYTPSRCGD